MAGPEVIAIVGASRAACGWARRAADTGHAVRLHHSDPAALLQAQQCVREVVDRTAAEGLGLARRQRILDGILATDDLAEAVTHAAVVVEALECTEVERRHLLMRLGEACRASAVVATAGEPDALMDYLANPGRLIGFSLPNDPDLPPGSTVEIVPGVETAAHALERARLFVRQLELDPRVRQVARG